jgi:hypothetical protein
VEPDLLELSDGNWRFALQLFGAVHYLQLAGTAPDALDGDWEDFRAAIEENRDWVIGFLSEQSVQTNEVQRCFALLPGFLTIARAAGRPLDLLELGPSAGLNLLWDRYGYAYAAGTWGAPGALLRLDGEERSPVPAELLATSVEVRRRRGLDLDPVDVTTEHGERLLRAFLWPGRREREERLGRAIETLRASPPELVQGDYVERLGAALEQRDPGSLTVVFETASRGYLSSEQQARVRAVLDEAAATGPLGWLATQTAAEARAAGGDPDSSYFLELAVWPEVNRTVVAACDFHGNWLEWRGL